MFFCVNIERAFQTFFHQFAGNFVWNVDIAAKMDCVCGATTAAMIFCPARFASFFGVEVAGRKKVAFAFVQLLVENVAQQKVLFAGKLMAGIQTAVRRYCKILATGATADKAFFVARAVFQIDGKVKK